MRTAPRSSRRRASRWTRAALVFAVIGTPSARAQGPDAIKARLDAARGPYLVGQGIELRIAVVERDQRPKLELPDLAAARLWIVDTSFQPISVGRIGRTVMSENMFLTRVRLVPRGAGALDVPPVVVRLGDREGRTNPLRLRIDAPPAAGRPADFLGGVGGFTAEAESDARQVRVGQEFLYRIRISGPAAWGTTGRPDLTRLAALPIQPRIEPLEDETADEPPRRALVYRVRPSRAGEVVLPPVSISAFDPRIQRYTTRATNGVPLRVVAVPAFKTSDLDYRHPEAGRLGRAAAGLAGTAALGALATVVFVLSRRLRNRWIAASRIGPGAARRHARDAAADLGGRAEESVIDTARRATDALIEYARLSVGRPPGALTPGEARAAVLEASGSEELGRAAERLAVRCDRLLFAESVDEAVSGRGEGGALARHARDLFSALGRPGGWRRRPAAANGPPDATTG